MFGLEYGAQLYTARKLMAEDVPGTLTAIASLGYSEFEFAGYFGDKPGEIRRVLDDLGVTAPSAHLGAEVFAGSLSKALDEASVLGHRYLVLPWWEEARRTKEGYRVLAELLNQSAEAAAKYDIKVAYHNHDFEFSPIGDFVPIHFLLAETERDLVYFELDLYWCAVMNCDPLSLFQAHPGRFALLHLKDRNASGEMVDVGAGKLDFAAVLAESESGGVEHAYVELDNAEDPLATFRNSVTYLAGL